MTPMIVYLTLLYEGNKDEFSRILPPFEKYKTEKDIYSINPSIYSQDKSNSMPVDFRDK